MLTGELKTIIDSGTKLTPMMQQYAEIKKDLPETLLLFRMGDFYELFFDDAKEAAKILNITLTHRGKLGDFSIPMAGIPYHAASTYIDRITAIGLKAAICEQVEDPKQAKMEKRSLVRRAVTQIVSPGIPFDLEKTHFNENRFIASCVYENDIFFLSLLDFTTGSFIGHALTSEEELLSKLQTYSPKEFICFIGQWDHYKKIKNWCEHPSVLTTCLSQDYFQEKNNSLYIELLIPKYKRDETLMLHSPILKSISALGYYISSTQGSESLYHIRPFKIINEEKRMKVSLSTLMGLEILPKSRRDFSNYKESVLGFMDQTKSSMGSRALKYLFTGPLCDLEEITKRQNLIESFILNEDKIDFCQDNLSEVRDLDRILAKTSSKKITASDLINLSATSIIYSQLLTELKSELKHETIPTLSAPKLKKVLALASLIQKTINDQIGAALEKGNLIREGANKKRDRLALISQNVASAVVELEAKYRKSTKVQKLRIKNNNLNGYFVEVTKSKSGELPPKFIRCQTLVNTERFITKELQEFEKEVVSANEKLEKLEKSLFDEIISQVSDISSIIQEMATSIGLIDAYHSLAIVCRREQFTKPLLVDDKTVLKIEGAWHPLIKAAIKEEFIAHNLTLSHDIPFGLITGPNMAGKTTVMREMAIIQFLAQIGSFVPAQLATLSLCDYLFSRLGASDDILKGHSTFMVEMTETAEILRHASDRSLIIMDEVGRGTSTFDGLSIAWALVEYFAREIKAKTLFSTHYHELIKLVESIPSAKNLTVETISYKGKVQFLYRLIEQGASQSFGIYVAQLAGLPKTVLTRATHLLKELEKEGQSAEFERVIDRDETQLSLFSESAYDETDDKLKQDLQELDLSNMTPIQVMQKVDEWQKRLP